MSQTESSHLAFLKSENPNSSNNEEKSSSSSSTNRRNDESSFYTGFLQQYHHGLWIFSSVVVVALCLSLSGYNYNYKYKYEYISVLYEYGGEWPPASIWDLYHTYVQAQFYVEPPPQSFMTTPELIRDAGYPVEEHKVRTGDGYILTLFRIPHGRSQSQRLTQPRSEPVSLTDDDYELHDHGNGTRSTGNFKTKKAAPSFKKPETGSREPVLLQHGLLSSSSDWFLQPTSKALPFLLVDSGRFDVWLANIRGNDYSNDHVNLTLDDLKYWDYCLDDLGREDATSMVTYILKETKAPQLSWISHSMGSSILYVGVNHDPTLNTKIRKVVSYSPAAFIRNIVSPPFYVGMNTLSSDMMLRIGNFFNGGRLLNPTLTRWTKKYAPAICSGKITSRLCRLVIFLTAGFNYKQTTETTASLLFGRMPSDTSVKIVAHGMQVYKNDRVAAFDYGEAENLKKYGNIVPPTYNLSLVNIPTLAIYGLNDWMNPPQDVLRSLSHLGNVQESHVVEDVDCNHMDFLFAKDAKSLFYDKTLEFLAAP